MHKQVIIMFMIYIIEVTDISTRVGSIGGGTRITIEGEGIYITYYITLLITFITFLYFKN